MNIKAGASSHTHNFKSFATKRDRARSIFIARALLVLMFFSMLLPTPDSIVPNRVMAAPGDLVPTFGTGGVVMTDFAGGNDSANAVAADLLGRIIAAGSATIPGQGTDFALACYDERGNLDQSFGDGGKVTTDFFGANDGVKGVAVQLDGKIVVSGVATNGAERQFALARYLEDGNLDSTFDQDGKLTLDLGTTSEAFKVAVQEDGKIVAVGDSRPQASLEMTVVRLNSADGSRDASFGNNGVVTIDFGNADRAIDLAIDEQNIFVCGFAVKTATDSDFGVARLNRSNGSLNNAFDGDGKVTVDFFGKQDGAQAIILGGPIPAANATNGVIETNDVDEPHIIVGGNATNTTAEDFAVAALDFKGNLIPTLFNQGKDTVDFNGGRDLLFGLINQPDGDIVADGWAGDGANFDLGMTKWKAGSLDLGFGVQGEYTLDTASGGNNVAFDGVINGVNIVTAGVGLNPITGNDDFVVTLHENEIFVEFTKTASPDPAVEGDLITYTFTIKNLTDTAIEVIIADSLSFRVSFDSARNPFWISTGTSARTNPIPVRSLETKEFTLAVRAMKSGLASNKGRLLSKDGRQFFAQDEVLHQITRAKVTDVTRDRKNLRVTMNSTGTNQSSTIAPNAIEPQASCPVVLYDGVEQKTSRDPIIQQPC